MGEKITQFDGTCDEIYALLVAEHIWPGMADKMQKWESPDWKDGANFIGLEVTRAQNKHYGYTMNVVAKYLGFPKEQIPTKILDGFSGYTRFHHGKLLSVSEGKGMFNGNRHVVWLLEHLKTKLQKLNSPHFSACKHNYLFEFGTGSFSQCDILEFQQGMNQLNSCHAKPFEKILVSTYDDVLCFSSNEDVVTYTLPVHDLTRMAKQYRMALKWEKGVPFSRAQLFVSKANNEKA